MKWHEACLSISAAILEILNAWENGVLAFESIQVAPPLFESLPETRGWSLRACYFAYKQILKLETMFWC